jgi:DNA polymerase III subunit epsilon
VIWGKVHFLARALGGRVARWLREIIDVRRLVLCVDALEGRGRRRSEAGGLAEAAERYGVPGEDAHHALWDAFMTAQLFLILATRLEAMGRGRLKSLVGCNQPRWWR